MPEIESKSPTTHPIGWSFLGAGAAFWLVLLFQVLRFDYAEWLRQFDVAVHILVLLFAASLLRIILDVGMIPVEKGLLRLIKLGGSFARVAISGREDVRGQD